VLVLDPDWPIFLETGEGELIVKNGQDGARFSEAVEAKVEGEQVTVAYNPTYLAELVAPVEEIELAMTSPLKPCVLTSDWYHAMLMPVRV
jgi:DNA polymerase-3 subunit beta